MWAQVTQKKSIHFQSQEHHTGTPLFLAKQSLSSSCQAHSRIDSLPLLVMWEMLRLASWHNQPKSVLCISTSDKPGEPVGCGYAGVKARGLGCFNLSISDPLMDRLIRNDSIDCLYVVMPGDPDESICGKSSHANSMTKRWEDWSTTWGQKKRRKNSVSSVRIIKGDNSLTTSRPESNKHKVLLPEKACMSVCFILKEQLRSLAVMKKYFSSDKQVLILYIWNLEVHPKKFCA